MATPKYTAMGCEGATLNIIIHTPHVENAAVVASSTDIVRAFIDEGDCGCLCVDGARRERPCGWHFQRALWHVWNGPTASNVESRD